MLYFLMRHQRIKFKLEDADYKQLKSYSRSTSIDYRYVLRSKILLLCDKKVEYKEITNKLGVSSATISKWKKRYVLHGLSGIKDKKGRGAKPIYTKVDKARVTQLACTKPEGGYTNWSQRRIAKKLGISQSRVNVFLKENELKPHKVDYWCGKSTDPKFEQKMLKIVGFYLNQPQNALILSVDEKTQIQAIDRSQPELPMKKGKAKRHTATYKRNGTANLLAALNVHEGEITARNIEKNTAENFLKFLKHLYRKYPHKQLHIIADNLSIHKEKNVKNWIKKRRRLEIHYTPTYSSWLNQIEIFFSILTKDVLKGGIWKSKKQLVSQLMQYIKTYNLTRAKPFNWTYNGKKHIL